VLCIGGLGQVEKRRWSAFGGIIFRGFRLPLRGSKQPLHYAGMTVGGMGMVGVVYRGIEIPLPILGCVVGV